MLKTGLFWSRVHAAERLVLSEALLQSDGNKTNAARYLGISFRSLRHLLKKHGARHVNLHLGRVTFDVEEFF